MKPRWVMLLALLGLVALTVSLHGQAKPLHLTAQPVELRVAARPVASVPLPELKKPKLPARSPVATRPARPPARSGKLAAAKQKPPPEASLPAVVSPEPYIPAPLPRVASRSVPRWELPDLPDPGGLARVPSRAPRPESLPAVQSPPPAPPLPAAPDPPADSEGVWRERQTDREPPQIEVTNRSRLRGELVLTRNETVRRWSWRRSGVVISDTVEPVEYAYEVRGPIYAQTGRPDLAGTLRCRKYRLYQIELFQRPWWMGTDTIYRDWGD